MAFTVRTIGRNVLGAGHREVVMKVTTDGTSGIVTTPLRWIEAIDVIQEQGTDRQVDVYPNSATASLTEDDPGKFFVGNCASSTTYRFLVMGK